MNSDAQLAAAEQAMAKGMAAEAAHEAWCSGPGSHAVGSDIVVEPVVDAVVDWPA